MKTPAPALLALALLLTPAAFAHDEDPIEAALRAPHATGLLVMRVVPQSAAASAGFTEGDVLVTYDGEAATDLPTLTALKEGAKDKERVACEVLRANGERMTVLLPPGPLGLQLVPIAEGSPPSPLPPDTGAVLDPAAADGRDEWFALSLGGEKRGLEHVTLRVEGDLLHFTHEVAFDGGEQWGLHHGIVRAVMRCGAAPQPVSLSYENGLNGWLSRSRVVRDDEGRAVWRSVAGPTGEEPQTTDTRLLGDESSVPSYAVLQLARLLPQEKGACLRIRPVADWDGKPTLPAAIVCVGSETVTIGATEHATWKYEQRQLGGSVLGTYWIDAQRRVVQADYGGAVATVATREAALAGLSEQLKLRTAD